MNESHRRAVSPAEFYATSDRYYHLANARTAVDGGGREWLRQWLPQNGRVLDVACGTGVNRDYVPATLEYVGADISRIGLAQAAAAGHPRSSYVVTDAARLPFADAHFDAVISTYAIEHFPDPRSALDEMVRVCRPGGRLALIAPAWEEPAAHPPSLRRHLRSTAFRRRYVVGRMLRYAWMILNPHAAFFRTYPDIAIDPDAYDSDDDAVYPVSVREVVNYLRRLGCKPVHVQTVVRTYRTPAWRHIVYNARTWILDLPPRRYFGTRLLACFETPSPPMRDGQQRP